MVGAALLDPDRQLVREAADDALASGAQVDNELAALKASLSGEQPGQLTGASEPAQGELPGGTFEQPPAPGAESETNADENLR